MSDGDGEDEPTEEGEAPEAAESTAEDAAPAETDAETDVERLDEPEEFETHLDAVADALERAETEADLDDVEADLDAVADALEAADLPEPEEGEDEEEAADPAADIQERVDELREQLASQRGPYAEDVIEQVGEVQAAVTGADWTDTGREDVREAVTTFLGAAGDALDESFEDPAADADVEALAAALDPATAAVEDAGLDPDDDAETVAALVEAADALAGGVDDAEEYDDLTMREQLRYEGFYEVLGEKHKDYPPEWSALKEWEKRENVEMVLLLLDRMGGSDFMERHCLESLERIATAEVVDPMLDRAGKRDKDAIRILGKCGPAAEEATETLHDYLDADPAMQQTTLKALGEIGSADSTDPVAQCLAAEEAAVRSAAARALGRLGDARAVDPLADVLGDDAEDDTVRASAAWALVQVGTREALEAAAEHADDPAYIVQAEAESAAEALGTDAATA